MIATQNKRVLERLRKGPITSHQALIEEGIARLAARVFDLKDGGVCITKKMIAVQTRDGVARVAQYELVA